MGDLVHITYPSKWEFNGLIHGDFLVYFLGIHIINGGYISGYELQLRTVVDGTLMRYSMGIF